MREEIVIGKGEHVCSSIVVFKIKGEHNIAENHLYYTSHRCIFDSEIKIYKYTKEGKQLTKMINDTIPIDKINKFLNKLILKRINPELILDYIEREKETSFNLGRKNKINEIKVVLDIWD